MAPTQKQDPSICDSQSAHKPSAALHIRLSFFASLQKLLLSTAMKLSGGLIIVLSVASSAAAFVQKPALSGFPATDTALGGSRESESDGMRKIGEAVLAATLFCGLLPTTVHAIDYRLPPIDRSDPNRCTLKSSSMGQSNAQRDKLFDLRECKLEGADAQGFDLSGVIM